MGDSLSGYRSQSFMLLAVICGNRRHRHMPRGKKFHVISIPGIHTTPECGIAVNFRNYESSSRMKKCQNYGSTISGVIAKRYVRTISVNHPSSHFILAKGEFNFKMSRSIASLYVQIDRCYFIYIRVNEFPYIISHVYVRVKRLCIYILYVFFFQKIKNRKFQKLRPCFIKT